jgi:enoyl-CoA hydratase
MSESLILYREQDGIAWITLNRPQSLNAMTPAMLEVLQTALDAARMNDAVGAVIITGSGTRAFSAGADIAYLHQGSLRLAVPHAMLGHPEVRIGAVAGFGGTTRLPRLIGRGRAAELLLTGRSIPAEIAFNMGLINQVVEPEQLLVEAERLAREILAQSPIAVKLTWEALHHGLNLGLEESVRIGADAFGLAASTKDFRTGTRGFLTKTPPAFEGQ